MQDLTQNDTIAVYVALGVALLGILTVFFLRSRVLAQDAGTARMQEIWGFIRAGSGAYLGRQFRILALVAFLFALLAAVSVLLIPPSPSLVQRFGGEGAATVWLAAGRAAGALIGALVSFAASSLGMGVAVAANVRVAAAARKGYPLALRIGYNAAAITGLMAASLGLLVVALVILLFGIAAPDILLGFALGTAAAALVLRVGGGVYAQAARAAAAFDSKAESGIAQDDPRNTALIAALVADPAGDSSGTSADMVESMELVFVAALILGLALAATTSVAVFDTRFLIFPLALRAIGLFATLIGNATVRTDERRRNALSALNRGFLVSAVLLVVGVAAFTFFYMADPNTGAVDWRPLLAVVVGVVLAVVLNWLTRLYTASNFGPVKNLGRRSRGGAAQNLLSGLALGLESSVWAVTAIGLAIVASVLIFTTGAAPEFGFSPALYGVALTALTVLALNGVTLSMSSFGAVADNANRIGALATLDKNARNALEDFLVVGTTTRALTRGLAIGATLLTAISVLGALFYLVTLAQLQFGALITPGGLVNIVSPATLVGLLLGSALPFLLASLTLRGVARATATFIAGVRRQLGTSAANTESTPDYAEAVDGATGAAQRELFSLGALVVFLPLLVGFLLGVESLLGLLAGALLTGPLLALLQSNAGAAWANVKTYIEDGNVGGKNSEAYRAALVGDGFGGPLRVASGPALNPGIKLLHLIALLLVPVIVANLGPDGTLGIVAIVTAVISLLVVIAAVWLGRRDVAE